MGVEPITYHLQSGCSAIELRRPDDKNAPLAAPGDYTKPTADESNSIHMGRQFSLFFKLTSTATRSILQATRLIESDGSSHCSIERSHGSLHGDADQVVASFPHQPT